MAFLRWWRTNAPAIPAMEARERENAARAARGGALLPMPEAWTSRPRLSEAESGLFGEFLLFAQFCGGDPRPTDALAWFDMRGVAQAEREWMAALFSGLAGVTRERAKED